MRGRCGEATSPEPGGSIPGHRGGGSDRGTSAAPPRSLEGTTALSGGRAGHRGFLLGILLPCPFFNQMFLILQEAEQGANLSLISEARPLI